MKVTEITVHAGRTFNHPYENYANFKPGVSLRATLSEEDDVEATTKALQLTAEQLAESQKQQILADLRTLERTQRIANSKASLQRELTRLQLELDALNKQDPAQLEHQDEYPFDE